MYLFQTMYYLKIFLLTNLLSAQLISSADVFSEIIQIIVSIV